MNITEFAMFKKMLGNSGGGGSNVPTCNIEVVDNDNGGPYDVTYTTPQGERVTKQTIYPNGLQIECKANTQITVSGGFGYSWIEIYDSAVNCFTTTNQVLILPNAGEYQMRICC